MLRAAFASLRLGIDLLLDNAVIQDVLGTATRRGVPEVSVVAELLAARRPLAETCVVPEVNLLAAWLAQRQLSQAGASPRRVGERRVQRSRTSFLYAEAH